MNTIKYAYSSTVITRIHGPFGYANYERYRPFLRDEFAFQCVYCLVREKMQTVKKGSFEIDHFIPTSVDSTLGNKYENLLYACRRCNSQKSAHENFCDPCQDAMGNHLRLKKDGTIEGISRVGKIMVGESAIK